MCVLDENKGMFKKQTNKKKILVEGGAFDFKKGVEFLVFQWGQILTSSPPFPHL